MTILSRTSNPPPLQAQCVTILEQLSYHINSQETELAAHQLLSVYKMAEVHIVSPSITSNSIAALKLSMPLVISAVTIVFCHHFTKMLILS